jgi:hypothetical protein
VLYRLGSLEISAETLGFVPTAAIWNGSQKTVTLHKAKISPDFLITKNVSAGCYENDKKKLPYLIMVGHSENPLFIS